MLSRNLLLGCVAAALGGLVSACSISGAERAALDTQIQRTVERCKALTDCGQAAARADGMLVMPDIGKGALVLGGAYGEGGLVEGGTTTGYYSLVSASIGLQLGYHDRSALLMFMTPSALADFKDLSGWDANRRFAVTAGSDVTDQELVSAAEVGLIDGAPAYVFIVEDNGLMADASWNGLKLTRMTVTP